MIPESSATDLALQLNPYSDPARSGANSVSPRPYISVPGKQKATVAPLRFAPLRKSGMFQSKLNVDKMNAARTPEAKSMGLARELASAHAGGRPKESTSSPMMVQSRPESDIRQLFQGIPVVRSADLAGTKADASVDSAAPTPVPSREQATPTTGAKRAKPFHCAASTVFGVLGSLWGSVHEGVNSAARGCGKAYARVHDACAALAHRVPNASDAGRAAHRAEPQSSAKAGALPPDISRLFGPASVAWSLQSVLACTDVMEDFKGEKITYANFEYLSQAKSFREARDAEGVGMNAHEGGKDNSSLMRRLITGAKRAHAPWRNPMGIPGPEQPQLDAAHQRYIAYRDARYPDFEAMYARLNDFADSRGTSSIKRILQTARAECEAKGGTFDQDAYFREMRVEIPPKADQENDSSAPTPVSIHQLSDDMSRMRKCLTEMMPYLEAL